jgi:hypothetical protein
MDKRTNIPLQKCRLTLYLYPRKHLFLIIAVRAKNLKCLYRIINYFWYRFTTAYLYHAVGGIWNKTSFFPQHLPFHVQLADYPALTGYLFFPIFNQTNTHPFYIQIIYITYKIIFLYMYLVICVPRLVEITPGVPELCWNIHTQIHPSLFCIYIYI